MRRWYILLLPLVASMLLNGCGGGGGGGGHAAAQEQAPAKVALFADSSYVDYNTTNPHSEGWGMHAALAKKGMTVVTFTGATATAFSDALADSDVIVLPEQSSLSAVLDTAARTALSDFVEDGGVLVLGGDSSGGAAAILNDVFGIVSSTTGGSAVEPIVLDTAAAADTRFADAPANLPWNNGTYTITGTWPYGAKVLYSDNNGDAVAVLIPRGQGFIVYLAWDWYDALPVGTQDGGWNGILATAANLGRTLPDVLYPDDSTTLEPASMPDVRAKLFATGQFNLVNLFNSAVDTPTPGELGSHDAVLVASGYGMADTTTMGNNLADFVDAGGGVVCSMFTYWNPAFNLAPGGRFWADNYFAIPGDSGQQQGTNAYLGSVFLPNHPIMNQVETFDGGSNSYRPDTLLVAAGATRVADWSDGSPLAAVRTIGGTRRADLGFYPVSSDARSDFWLAGTDGDLLMANALTWTARFPVSRRLAVDEVIPNNTGAALASTITVAGGPAALRKVTVTVNIEHTYAGDLALSLTSPAGTTAVLALHRGVSANNYMATTFDDAGRTAIGSGAAPFTGSFRPEEALSAFAGEDADGGWTLTVLDDVSGDSGTLLGWTLCVR